MSGVKTGDWADEMAENLLPEVRECFGYRSDQGWNSTAYLTLDREEYLKLVGEALRLVERRTAEECGIICQQNPNHHQGAKAIRERFHLEDSADG